MGTFSNGISYRGIAIGTDIHCGANNALMAADELLSEVLMHKSLGYFVFLNGDDLDRTNCKKSELNSLEYLFESYIWHNCNGFNTGNHYAGKDYDELKTYIINGKRVGFIHGDRVSWGLEKSTKYRNKDHGAGWFKRNIIVNAIEGAELLIDRTRSNKLYRNIELFVNTEAKDCDIVFMSHLHPRKTIEHQVGKTKVYILRRGFSTYDI